MRPLPLRSTPSFLRATRAVATAATIVVLVACSPAASQSTVPPDATGSLLPPATATVPPSQGAAASPSAAFPVSLVDDDGTSVDLAAAPHKIVSLTPAETEVLYAIGAGDQVVGKVQDPASFPPEADRVPEVGDFSAIDVEKIVGLGADLVIAGGNGGTPADAITKLRSLKIPVLVIYAPTVDGVLHDIDLTGRAVGKAEAADRLELTMKQGFEAIAKSTDSLAKPRVYYETGDQPAVYGIADNSVYAQMIDLAGGTPVTTGSASNWEMPTEKLVAADPQLIILGDAAYGVKPEAVGKRPGWGSITAVKNKAILPIDDILVTRPGPRLVDGLRLLVGAIHPEVALPAPSGAASPAGSSSTYGG